MKETGLQKHPRPPQAIYTVHEDEYALNSEGYEDVQCMNDQLLAEWLGLPEDMEAMRITHQIIQDGRTRYLAFLKRWGIKYSDVLTPHDSTLRDFYYSDNSDFMKLALTELLRTYGGN